MFGNWIVGVNKNIKDLIFVKASAICWALWLNRNEMDFDRSPSKSYIFAGSFQGNVLAPGMISIIKA